MLLEKLKTHGLASRSAGNVALRVFSLGLSFLLSVVLARVLGAHGYGEYAYIFGIVTLLSIPIQLGIPTLLMRSVAKYEALKEWRLLRGILRRSYQAVVCLSILIGMLAALIYFIFFRSYLELGSDIFLWGLVFMVFISLAKISAAGLVGFRKPLQATLPYTLVQPAVFIAILVVLAYVFSANISPSRAMAINAGSGAVAFFAGVTLLLYAIPENVKGASPRYRSREWAATIIPLSLMTGLQVVNAQVDIVMLGSMATKDQLGIYRAALRLSALTPLVVTAVLRVIAPYVAGLYARNEGEKLQRLIIIAARLTTLMAIPLTVCYLVVPRWVLGMTYGHDFALGDDALRILAAGQFLNAAAGTTGMIMRMTEQERIGAKVIGIAAISNIALNALLIPHLGMLGSAIGTAFSGVVLNILLFISIRRRLGLWSLPIGKRWAGKPLLRH